MRKSNGAFKSVDDLRAIKGIGPKKLDKTWKYLSVGKPAQSKQGATSAQAKAPPGKSAVAAKPVPAEKKSIEPRLAEEEEP
jgi:DNA polymerase/3'-5' exonuclease PolX